MEVSELRAPGAELSAEPCVGPADDADLHLRTQLGAKRGGKLFERPAAHTAAHHDDVLSGRVDAEMPFGCAFIRFFIERPTDGDARDHEAVCREGISS